MFTFMEIVLFKAHIRNVIESVEKEINDGTNHLDVLNTTEHELRMMIEYKSKKNVFYILYKNAISQSN